MTTKQIESRLLSIQRGLQADRQRIEASLGGASMTLDTVKRERLAVLDFQIMVVREAIARIEQSEQIIRLEESVK